MTDPDTHLQRILALHFDPDTGTPYWLDRQRALGLDVRRDIRHAADLPRLGPLDESALAERPISDWIPRRFADDKAVVLAETAGTLGAPKFAAHRSDEFQAAFVTPFVRAAAHADFPRDGHWLFVGPTGPHIIGRAARACARAWGRGDVFTVDFDPRWAKKLTPGSFAAQRYLTHVRDQALAVLAVQPVDVLFSTPPVLRALAEALDPQARAAIRGLHLGGLAVDADFMADLAAAFPRAVILAGYGNTLLGMAPQLAWSPETGMDYFPHGPRLILNCVAEPEPGSPIDLTATVPVGRRGRVVAQRLDALQLLLNLVERDTAVRIAPPPALPPLGFIHDGLRDPRPLVNAATRPTLGLY